MSKSARRVKGFKKIIEKVIHPPYLETQIPAGKAMPGPPLGPHLGQREYCRGTPLISSSLKALTHKYRSSSIAIMFENWYLKKLVSSVKDLNASACLITLLSSSLNSVVDLLRHILLKEARVVMLRVLLAICLSVGPLQGQMLEYQSCETLKHYFAVLAAIQ
ncbi:39S ribosomal protein L11, mitochondrial, partial [Stegodyphus mimosarum]